ncbi:MAG TPA: putative molybdenum carrier protein [Thermoguttaceae bacterium]
MDDKYWQIIVKKIISGGQTGVDRAALDVAISLGIAHGGWCPLGRLAEDGRIADRYQLKETDSPDYPVRTERNVLDSDATLILCRGPLTGGTLLTHQFAEQHQRPCLVVDLDSPLSLDEIRHWMREHRVEVLNVAGPRESQCPNIAQLARDFLLKLFAAT